MTQLRCSNCATDNPADARFCQKCGTRLLTVCKQCGTENLPGMVFCKNCGTNLAEAKFVLSPERFDFWRTVLTSSNSWQPPTKIPAEVQETLAALNPPYIPAKEQFILCKMVGGGTMVGLPYRLPSVTVHGRKFQAETWSWTANRAFLIGTDSRLIILYEKRNKPFDCVPYDQIAGLDVDGNNYVLSLQDGTQATIETKFGGFSFLAAAVILTAPPVTKGQVAQMEMSKADDAKVFALAFAEFFREIVRENKRRAG